MPVWCRAVSLRVFVYFVRDHTRPTVPRGRSAAALRDVGEVPEILHLSERCRTGKWLSGSWLQRTQRRVSPRGCAGGARCREARDLDLVRPDGKENLTHLVDTPRAKMQSFSLPPSQNLLSPGHAAPGCISFQRSHDGCRGLSRAFTAGALRCIEPGGVGASTIGPLVPQSQR